MALGCLPWGDGGGGDGGGDGGFGAAAGGMASDDVAGNVSQALPAGVPARRGRHRPHVLRRQLLHHLRRRGGLPLGGAWQILLAAHSLCFQPSSLQSDGEQYLPGPFMVMWRAISARACHPTHFEPSYLELNDFL